MSSENFSSAGKVPQHLGHRPFFAMGYSRFDGAGVTETDMRFLSVGLFQYDQKEVSVKTMRHTGKMWSRQAEELPVHRVFDLALFAAKVLFDSDRGRCVFPEGLFCNQGEGFDCVEDPNRTPDEREAFEAWLEDNGGELKERLKVLAEVLDSLRERGRL